MDNYVLFFDQVEPNNLELVGRKCLNLSELYKKRFPVPFGFCVTSAAYEDFLAINKVDTHIRDLKQALQQKKKFDPEILEKIRSLIIDSPFPATISRPIEDAYSTLTKKNIKEVAVRSSAVLEDSEALSFAGQHQTFLCIKDKRAFLESIKNCWASLWQEPAITYRLEHSLEKDSDLMAVIVQQMAQSYVSGVMFTANPLNGDQHEIVINATWGLGEMLVNGQVDPDNIISSKESEAIKKYAIGQKKKASIPKSSESSGTATISNKDKSNEACLDKENVKKLVRLAKRIEQIKKAPQDIEWCLWRDEIYILQTRPITAFTDFEGEEHWTTDNAQEAAPGTISPLAGRFMEKFLNEQFQNLLEMFGLRKKFHFAKAFDGHFYLNVKSFSEIMSTILPGVDGDVLVKQLLGQGNQGKLKIKPGLKALKLLPKALSTFYKVMTLPSKLPKILDKFDTQINDFKKEDIEKYTAQESIEAGAKIYEVASDRQLLTYGMYATTASTFLFTKLTEFIESLPEELSISPSFFFTGLGALEDANQKEDIKLLAKEARGDQRLQNLILTEKLSEIPKKLEEIEESPFKKSFSEFLKNYGHLSESVVDLMFPRWEEDPTPIFKILRAHLASDDKQKLGAEKFLSRDEARAKVNSYLKNRSKLFLFKKWRFGALLKLATKYVSLRENFRFHIPHALFKMRLLFLRQGQILKEHGYLEEENEVFFLYPEEIEKALTQDLSQKYASEMIEKRRAGYERSKKTKPARHLYVKGNRVRKEYDQIDMEAEMLEGVPASGGLARGRARVIHDISQADRVRKGEILVTRATDPSWTPLFSLAKGLVVDIGSTLSHGAIIARELGIPAVMGVRFGTDVIKNGEEVIVDGTSGKVYLKQT